MTTQKLNEISWLVLNFALLSVVNVFVYAQEKTAAVKNTESKTIETKNADLSANTTLEEKLIRIAYRKLSVYETVQRFDKAEKENQPRGQALAEKGLRFKLKDFRVGPIQEILNVRYRDLVTSPTGEIIQIGTGTTRHNVTDEDGLTTEGEEKFSIDAKWKSAQYASRADEGWTVGDILQLEAMRFHNVGEYASYEVTVSLEGKTKTYHAIAFFHNPYQSSTQLDPEFLDSTVGMGGVVTQVFKETKIPLRTRRLDSIQNIPNDSDKDRLDSRLSKKENYQSLMSACGEDWFPGCGGGNCLEWYSTPIDPTYTYCMVWEPTWGGGDPPLPRCSLKVDYAGIETKYEKDPQHKDHITGNHSARTDFDSTCTRDVSCNVHCQVVDTLVNVNEDDNDNTSIYYHVGRTNVASEDHDGGLNQDISCVRTRGFYFNYCLFKDCAFSIAVSIGGIITVNPPGNEVWSTALGQRRTCKMTR